MKKSTLKTVAWIMARLLTCAMAAVLSLAVAAEAPEIDGDASRLTVSKSSYAEGEAIMVSAVGSGTDWIGIYRVGAPHSIRWIYVDSAKGGPGSGKEVIHAFRRRCSSTRWSAFLSKAGISPVKDSPRS